MSLGQIITCIIKKTVTIPIMLLSLSLWQQKLRLQKFFLQIDQHSIFNGKFFQYAVCMKIIERVHCIPEKLQPISCGITSF